MILIAGPIGGVAGTVVGMLLNRLRDLVHRTWSAALPTD
jgi:hypothetical protein